MASASVPGPANLDMEKEHHGSSGGEDNLQDADFRDRLLGKPLLSMLEPQVYGNPARDPSRRLDEVQGEMRVLQNR